MLLYFERVELLKGVFAVELHLILELDALFVEVVRRMLLPLRSYARRLIGGFLWPHFLLLLLLLLLPLLVDLSALGRVLLVDRLDLLLYFGE